MHAVIAAEVDEELLEVFIGGSPGHRLGVVHECLVDPAADIIPRQQEAPDREPPNILRDVERLQNPPGDKIVDSCQ